MHTTLCDLHYVLNLWRQAHSDYDTSDAFIMDLIVRARIQQF